MSETGQHPLNPIEEFAASYVARETLAVQAATASETLRDLYEQGVARAQSRLQELAQDNAVAAYYRDLGQQPVRLLAELETVRPMLESLGMHEQVEAKRAEVESLWLSTPEMRAARYFMDQGLLEAAGVEYAGMPRRAAEQPDTESVADRELKPNVPPADAAPTPEKTKRSVKIEIDPRNNILINGRPMSLSRNAQSAKGGQEVESRQMRVDIMRVLAANPDRTFRPNELWEAIRPGTVLDKSQWELYVREFFANPPTYRNKPLFVAEKVKAKLNLYSLGDFDVIIEDTKKFAKVDESIYVLPDGQEVAGKTARLLQMMLRASAEKPVTHHDISDWYEKGELASPASALSSMASTVRTRLQGTNLRVQKVPLEERNPDTKRSYVGYYAVEVTPENQGSTEKTDNNIGASPSQPEAGSRQEPLGLHEATVLAGFLEFYADKLQAAGLAPLPAGVFDALNQRVIETYTNGQPSNEKLDTLRQDTFETALALLEDEEKLCEFENSVDAEDPRLNLLLSLIDYTGEDQVNFLRKLLQSRPEIRVSFDAGRLQGFRVVEVATRTVCPDGEEL